MLAFLQFKVYRKSDYYHFPRDTVYYRAKCLK